VTYTKESKRSLEDVEQRLRAAAQAHKFGVLNVLDIQQTLKSKGIDLQKACKIFDICNPQAASQALNTDMRVSVALPCRISAFSSETGTTLATIHPTDLLRATGMQGVDELAQHIERELVAIIDETV